MSQAKIFLSDERGVLELDTFRSYNTFNFGNYQHQYKSPVENLYLLNDDTLAAGKSINLEIQTDSLVLLLPVVGAVDYRDSAGNASLVKPGELQAVLLPAGSSYTISNLYDDELVNFLQVWIKVENALPIGKLQVFSFDLDQGRNCFHSFDLLNGYCFHIAKFTGRQKAAISFKRNVPAVFSFIVEGAFELKDRLLHTRDGLALWNCNEVDMEALSNDAIVFLFEL